MKNNNNNNMIIGDKDIFAIEFEIVDSFYQEEILRIFAKTAIWFENKRFGDFETAELIGVLLAQLLFISKMSISYKVDKQISRRQLEEIFRNTDCYPEFEIPYAFPIENFDDYRTAVYMSESEIVFFIELFRNFSAYAADTRGSHIVEVNKSYFAEKVKVFETEVSALQNNLARILRK